jgi:APA family basic amino acid/polyamine antiporter
MVQGLGLFSATAIVVGSMIGSGIFIVSADISRGVDSPALLIAAWVVTAVMTIIGALSYGELAAMMPRAGGQYVYLREALGPMWGFLYGWTLFLVIQTGTIAAVAVAFGKFLGVFFPSVSASHWLWHIGHVPAWRVGPMLLGNMDIGLNTANLAGILVLILLAVVNVFGLRFGAMVQNLFTTAKVASLLGLIGFGLLLGRNPAAIAANFGPGWHAFWQNASFSSLHPVQVGVGGPMAMVGMFTVLAVVQVGSLFSADAWNNVTFTAGEVRNPRRNLPIALALGTGLVLTIYILANFVYLCALPLHGDPQGATAFARGIQYAAEDRVATAVLDQILHWSGASTASMSTLVSTSRTRTTARRAVPRAAECAPSRRSCFPTTRLRPSLSFFS